MWLSTGVSSENLNYRQGFWESFWIAIGFYLSPFFMWVYTCQLKLKIEVFIRNWILLPGPCFGWICIARKLVALHLLGKNCVKFCSLFPFIMVLRLWPPDQNNGCRSHYKEVTNGNLSNSEIPVSWSAVYCNPYHWDIWNRRFYLCNQVMGFNDA